MSRRAAAALALAASLALPAGASLARSPDPGAAPSAAARAPASTVSEAAVHEVAAELRCVVCQALSVADSPSETAHQMREIIRDRLASGETPEQVKAYFVDKYGLWILLAPPRRGFTLLVWVVPFAALLAGLALVALLLRRWSRRPGVADAAPPPLDPEMRQRIERELSDLGMR